MFDKNACQYQSERCDIDAGKSISSALPKDATITSFNSACLLAAWPRISECAKNSSNFSLALCRQLGPVCIRLRLLVLRPKIQPAGSPRNSFALENDIAPQRLSRVYHIVSRHAFLTLYCRFAGLIRKSGPGDWSRSATLVAVGSNLFVARRLVGTRVGIHGEYPQGSKVDVGFLVVSLQAEMACLQS